jgi:hypothetical protein
VVQAAVAAQDTLLAELRVQALLVHQAKARLVAMVLI